MTDTATDIDLPRFSRLIGVSSLASVEETSESLSKMWLVRPFTGVLDTAVRLERPSGAVPSLSYLTLAPLLTRAFTRERTSGLSSGTDVNVSVETDTSNRTLLDRPSDESVGNGTANAERGRDEPTVRERLRESGQTRRQPTTRTDAGGSDTAGFDDTDTGEGLSTVTRFDRTVRTLAERPGLGTTVGKPPRSEASARGATTADEGFGAAGPVRTVVDRGERRNTGDETTDTGVDVGSDADGQTVREVLRATETESAATVRAGGPSRPDTEVGDGSRSAESFRTGVTRTVRLSAPPLGTESERGSDSRAADSGLRHILDSSGLPREEGSTRPGGAEEPVFDGRTTSSPRLTVVGKGVGEGEDSGSDGRRHISDRTDGRRLENGSHGPHDDRGGEQSTTRRRSGPDQGRRETTATPSVFDPDGSVNDRVLDRLYAELRRKERIERDREGR